VVVGLDVRGHDRIVLKVEEPAAVLASRQRSRPVAVGRGSGGRRAARPAAPRVAASPRRRTIAGAALDEHWMDEVGGSRGLLVTARGLLMYFEPAAVRCFLASCARRLPGAALVFDAVPEWMKTRSGRGGDGYRPRRPSVSPCHCM
jgi:hypothetical protein